MSPGLFGTSSEPTWSALAGMTTSCMSARAPPSDVKSWGLFKDAFFPGLAVKLKIPFLMPDKELLKELL